ncbi:MAG: 3-isopropylmalate dehydratase [Negativicutes bacterium]|nr:3-isopropylmalate dehydratase [Negativicutes bacterium]
MKIAGKAVVFNHDDICTDEIYPGPYVNLTDPAEIAEHVLEGADKSLKNRFKTVGNILVTGSNFGCGSSREQAVIAIKESGVKAVIAGSVGRIWYRNAINLGFPVLICPGLAAVLKEGDGIEIDLRQGTVKELDSGTIHQGEAIPDFVLNMFELGGLKPMMRKKGGNADA